MPVALTTAMKLEALQNSRQMTEESVRPRQARQVASAKPDGPTDQLNAANDKQSSPPKKQKSTTWKKSPKKSPPTLGEKRAAAAYQRAPTPTSGISDGQKIEKEFDQRFRQLQTEIDTKLETLTKQLKVMISKLGNGKKTSIPSDLKDSCRC